MTGTGTAFIGRYGSWEDAKRNSTGYDERLILEKVKAAALLVKNGGAAFERDSVAFDTIQHPFPVLACLLRAAAGCEGRLSVLDYGGSLGSLYFQSRGFLSNLKELRWNIVEQPHFIECGKELFENDELRFYNSVEECFGREHPDAALFSGVLQYVENPGKPIGLVINQGVKSIIVDRTPFTDSGEDILTVQRVPPSIYRASYPSWIFSERKFVGLFAHGYSKVVDFDANDGTITSGGITAHYRGYMFEKNDRSSVENGDGVG